MIHEPRRAESSAARRARTRRRRFGDGGLNLKPSGRMHVPESLEAGSPRGPLGEISVADAVFSCRDVSVFYGAKQALKSVTIDVARRQVLAAIGPVGLRQVDLPALPQPHERHDPGRPGDRHDHARRPGHLLEAPGRRAAARAHRHGLPEAESVSEVDLRQRGVRSAHPQARPRPRRPRRDRLHQPAARGAVGRGQGPPGRTRHWGSPAASSSASASRARWPCSPRSS